MPGLDVGTSFIVLSQEKNGNIEYKDFRDAFYVIKPTTPVATKMIEKGLSGKIFIKDDDFDVGYHEDVVTSILSECGYDARAINEAEALCYAELENDDYTGIGISCGAGMTNVCVMLNGEPTVVFSTTKSGDWIDRMSAVATGEPDSVVQAEKEQGDFKIGEENENPVLAAVSAYYDGLIDYTTKQLSQALINHKSLPKFKEPLKIVVAGGTSQAKGYIETFRSKLNYNNFPLQVKDVVHAKDPLYAVSKGCLIASKVL